MLQRRSAQQSRDSQDYIVQSGDSPYSIAQSNGVNLQRLLSANGLSEHSVIHPGDQLQIPNSEGGQMGQETQSQTYSVRTGDSLWRIAEQLGVSMDSLMHLNGLGLYSTLQPNQVLKIPGRVSPQAVQQASSAQESTSSAQSSANQQSTPTQQSANSTQQSNTAPKDPVAEKAKKASGHNGYNAALGRQLAMASNAEARGRRRAGGRCYAGVANAVDRVIGRFLTGMHAYMAASQLASRPELFTEIPAGNLRSLPAGAIVVWGKGSSESGHISIAQGNGMETSDFIGNQMTYHYGGASARVFLPKSRM